jgi:hypothetical protein
VIAAMVAAADMTKLYAAFLTIATILIFIRAFEMMRGATSGEHAFKGFVPIFAVVMVVGAWKSGVLVTTLETLGTQATTFAGDILSSILG